jgi:hypothetical protein
VTDLKELLIKQLASFPVLYWHSRGRIYENRETTLAGQPVVPPENKLVSTQLDLTFPVPSLNFVFYSNLLQAKEQFIGLPSTGHGFAQK